VKWGAPACTQQPFFYLTKLQHKIHGDGGDALRYVVIIAQAGKAVRWLPWQCDTA
jgi:hypothetical protein